LDQDPRSTHCMPRQARIVSFVATVALASAVCAAALWAVRLPFPGWWPVATFLFVSALLETLTTQLRISAKGSTSFITQIASVLLFGGWWGSLITAISTLFGEVARANRPIKLIFNVSQRILAISLAALAYHALGGALPPAFLTPSASLASDAVQRDLGLFLVISSIYFVVSWAAVNTAIVLSSDSAFREVWNLNTRGVLVYDIVASLVSILVAWLYTRFDQWMGFGSLGLLGVIVPIIAVRHVYGLYHQLEHSGQELLQVMVKAIEARDPYTSGHSLRVSKMSRAVAVELGLPARAIEEIETAALLHDVGKIHEEFAPLLRKEGRLTDEETALMQTHSEKSADLVGIISKFHGFIQESVLHHHERWDGQGYPHGLSGKNIPLGARIILIADTVDAMTTDRPYRKRLQLDIVIDELQKCKGTQFDPELIDVVIDSVAVRGLIAGATTGVSWAVASGPPGSKRVTWSASGLWKRRA
jgi:HD-GYP domain-containing protein (c-di-GMP phosphodiesterase class II)